jgi:heat induced stress protein YflT
MPSAEEVAVAIYNTHDEAEQAVKTLAQAGFNMRKLSIVGKDYHTEEHVVGYYNTGDRMKAWGKDRGLLGGLWGLLFGAAFFFIPGIGPAGPGRDEASHLCAGDIMPQEKGGRV